MNKKILILLLIIILLGTTSCTKNIKSKDEKEGKIVTKENNSVSKNNLVSYNGKLKLDGVDIVNQYNEKFQLRGMSSHGLQWYANFINEENIKILKDEWHSNIFRIAMYTAEDGYLSNKNLSTILEEKVDMIIKNDMYVIIDWHTLKDTNPMNNIQEAKDFFSNISLKYKDSPNVIYEICNEPNGSTTWNNDIKPYADEIIKVIRENSKDSLIIVGTPTWSQDILDPINNRINDKNTMYALHFYAGTHTDWLRQRIVTARENNIPIFVSEWGTTQADGNGGVFQDETKKWINFMNEYNLSWTNWSLSDKDESSAILKPGTSVNGFKDEDLTESGQLVKQAIKGEL